VFAVLLGLWTGILVTDGTAQSAEFVVDPAGGATFSTLSGAVAAAPSGALIRIRPGTYTETVVIDKDLVLLGVDADLTAVIDGERRRPLVRIVSAVTCRFENLNLRNGLADAGAAVYLSGGAVVDFINCSFHDNLARDDGGAVLVRGAGTWAEFIGCHFQRNRALHDAGAVSVMDGAELTLRACVFFANATDGLCGGVANFSRAPLAVEDCLFIENLGFECGAVRIYDSPARVVGNTFFQNSSIDGASVFVHDTAIDQGVEITNNIFAGDLEGAGLRIPGGAWRGCNVYSDNLAGPMLDGEPADDELVADPGFCDFRSLDLSLCRTSPASGRTSQCGRIGALDVGCLESLAASAADRPRPQRRVH
jgi:nitrous oxidase accessory protein NosD